MKVNYRKLWRAINNEEKLPRKAKKVVLGRKLNKRKLKKLLSSVRIIKNKHQVTQDIFPFLFCPDCGCQAVRFVDHCIEWPEVWNEEFCLRCGRFVGGADNSEYSHVLEELGHG